MYPLTRALTVAALLVAVAPLASAQHAGRAGARDREPATSAYPDRIEAHPLRGGATVYTSRAAFDAACPGLPAESFEDGNVAPGDFEYIEAPLSATTNNPPAFFAGDVLPGLTVTTYPLLDPPYTDLFVSGDGYFGTPSIQVGTNATFVDLVLEFDPIVACAGFDADLNSVGRPTTITAFDASGNALGSVTISGFALRFAGFSCDASCSIARIVFASSRSAEYADVDNVSFGGSTCALALSGEDIAPNEVAQGGTVTFSGSVVNAGPGSEDVALRATYAGLVSGTLDLGSAAGAPPGTYPFSRPVRVPANAPAGAYVVTLQVVNASTGVVCDTYTETVTVAPASHRPGQADGRVLFEATAPGTGLFGEGAFTASATPPAPAGVVVSPNPSAGRTTLSFSLTAAAAVRLAVYDVLGREVAVLVDEQLDAGAHMAVFDASALPAGLYVYQLIANGRVASGRVTVAY
jgi:hypothetical protein